MLKVMEEITDIEGWYRKVGASFIEDQQVTVYQWPFLIAFADWHHIRYFSQESRMTGSEWQWNEKTSRSPLTWHSG